MDAKRADFPKSCRLYRLLLLLYPRRHRREYGGLMVQLFRDQCREAHREKGARGLCAVWWRVPADLILSALKEHLSNLKHDMKTRTIHQLTQILFAAGVLLAMLANPAAVGSAVATMFLYLSTLAILARAVVDWFRPSSECLKGLGWGLAVMVAYALIMPFWAKLHTIHGSAFPMVPALHAGAIFMNLIVPIINAVRARTGRVAQ